MGDIVEQVGELTKTAEIENLLMGIAYWLVVIIIILFVFLYPSHFPTLVYLRHKHTAAFTNYSMSTVRT